MVNFKKTEKVYSQTCEYLRKAALVFLIFIMIYIVTVCFIFPEELTVNRYSYLQILYIPIGCVLASIVLLIFGRTICTISKKSRKKVLIAMSFVMFLTQILIVIKLQNVPANDLCHITAEVERMLQEFKLYNVGYFGKYPNNMPLLFIVYAIYRIGVFLGIDNLNLFASFINILAIDVSILFMYLTVKKISGDKTAAVLLMLSFFNPLLYIYAPYYYTDTLSMPFFSSIIYLFMLIEKTEDITKRRKIVYTCLIGLLSGVGFLIRATVIIPVIAILVYSFFVKHIKKNMVVIAAAFAGLFLVNSIYSVGLSKFTDMDYINNEKKFPVIHWVMMGLGETGSYNNNDMKYTRDAGDTKEKKEADMLLTKVRLKELGVKGLISHTWVKTRTTWSGGTGAFYKKLKTVRKYSKIYDVLLGDQNRWFVYYCIFYNGAFRLFTLVGLIVHYKKKKSGFYDFLYTAATGAILFYWLWEAGSRYSICFIPITAILMSKGICDMCGIFQKEVVDRISYKLKELATMEQIPIKKINISKSICYVAVLLIILVQIIGGYRLCIVKSQKKSISASQECYNAGTYSKTVTSSYKLKQTFKAFEPFENIEIKVKKSKKPVTCIYKLTLLDDNDYIIACKTFSSNDVDETEIVSLEFAKEIPVKGQEYTISLSTESEEGALKVRGVRSNEYCVYPDGKSYVNGNSDDNFRWAFSAFMYDNVTDFSIFAYIPLMIIIDACVVYLFIHNRREYAFYNIKYNHISVKPQRVA